MAESESGQEKTEEPTAKKLREAKEKGQVPRSKELNAMTILVFGAIGFLFLGRSMLEQLMLMMSEGFSFSREELFAEHMMSASLIEAVLAALMAILPFLILMVLVAVFTPALMGGWTMSSDMIRPKLSRINPIEGLGRIFSVKGLMELVKAIGKVSVVAVSSYIIYLFYSQEILNLGREPFYQALYHGAYIFGFSFLFLSCALVFIAAIDVPFQLYQHNKELKMTLQEVRDEMKETEGRPEVKSKIRQIQQEMSQKRMMEDVPQADVIITNPTHYAVALKYDPETMAVPILLAKGKDLMAFRIREVAKEHEIEIFEAPPLARAVYASCDIQQEIPHHLFFAVAQVLAFVFQLRASKAHGVEMPERPDPYVDPKDDIQS